MIERIALTFALIAFLMACVCLVLRWDQALFALRLRFSLRTLLVLLAIAPPIIAACVTLGAANLDNPAIQGSTSANVRSFTSKSTPFSRRIPIILILSGYFGALALALFTLPKQQRPPLLRVAIVYFLGLAMLWWVFRPFIL
jgi:hypothetical protein